jgi:hypothetical protein
MAGNKHISFIELNQRIHEPPGHDTGSNHVLRPFQSSKKAKQPVKPLP